MGVADGTDGADPRIPNSGVFTMQQLSPLMRSVIWTVALGSTVALGACDSLDELLSVEAPSKVVASDLEDPAAADLLVRSVGNEFRCAFTHYVNASALTGMEFNVAVDGAALIIWEQRRHDTSGFGSQYAQDDCADDGPALYLPVARTRWFADEVLRRLDRWGTEEVAEKTRFEAEVAAFAGYSYVLLGESMCTVAFDEGPEQPPSAAFELAVQRFDQSISAAQSSGADDFLNLARVGKARALLNLGRPSDAGDVAANVPAGYSFSLEYSGLSDETFNKVHLLNHSDQELTVDEPYRDMSFGGVPDPRVSVTDEGVTGEGTDIPVWTADKYTQVSSPMELASWEEAQLIMAEAALAEDRLQDAVDIINVLHSNADLPQFSSTDAGEIRDQIIYERQAELFLEGHHLMDLKRLDIPLLPEPGTDLPFGGSYGDEICFQLPAVEFLNNPNIERT